jgi:hypothetical protein
MYQGGNIFSTPNEVPECQVAVDLCDGKQEGKDTNRPTLSNPSGLKIGQSMPKVVVVVDNMPVTEVPIKRLRVRKHLKSKKYTCILRY